MRRLTTTLSGVLLAAGLGAGLVAGCGGDSSSGAAITGKSTVEKGDEPAGVESPPASKAAEPTTQAVGLGPYGEKPEAKAAATFYQELWRSYQTGAVTPGITKVATENALAFFRPQVEGLKKKGHTINNLSAARVVKVKSGVVTVCMASASYQTFDRESGDPIDEPESGFTAYTVRMTKEKSAWKVDNVSGISGIQCGEAATQ